MRAQARVARQTARQARAMANATPLLRREAVPRLPWRREAKAHVTLNNYRVSFIEDR